MPVHFNVRTRSLEGERSVFFVAVVAWIGQSETVALALCTRLYIHCLARLKCPWCPCAPGDDGGGSGDMLYDQSCKLDSTLKAHDKV